MIEPTSSTTQAHTVAQPTGTPTQKSPGAASHTGGDSVELSKAAQASLATLQELRETSAQTAKEAAHGDRQAQHLLAQEIKPAIK
jgi:hypothetical protein